MTLDYSTWVVLVLLRYAMFACVDVLGEGLMVMLRRLEEEAKEFFDEVDNINIVGTYITARGFSRAISSTVGAYLAVSSEGKLSYIIASVLPLAMAVFAKETFHELPVNESRSDWREVSRKPISSFCAGLENFWQIISISIVAVHLSLLLLVSALPVGDLAHRQLFMTKAKSSQPELILLVYVYHSLITYGLLLFIVNRSQSLNKKYLTIAGLVSLLLATLPPLFLTNEASVPTTSLLLVLSTLFHLFSHLGHSLILLSFYSLFLPFMSRTFLTMSLASGLIKAMTLLQPLLDQTLTKHVITALSQQVFLYWLAVCICLVVYALLSDPDVDRRVEEALILVRYHEVKSAGDEDERKLFKTIEEMQADSHDESSGSEGSGLEGIRHF